MDSRTVKVLSAILIGGALGIATMMGVAPSWWPLGLAVGFLGGYVSYDFETVRQAVPRAWRVARGWDFKAVPSLAKQALRPLTLVVFTAIGAVIVPMLIICWSTGLVDSSRLFWGVLVFGLYMKPYIDFLMKFDDSSSLSWRDVWDMNPVKVYLYDIPRLLVREVAPFMAKFSWYLFKLIHSEVRLLCGLDAALCSMIFHYSGHNIFLGLFAGLACGFLQFEIISKRVLKVVPVKAR